MNKGVFLTSFGGDGDVVVEELPKLHVHVRCVLGGILLHFIPLLLLLLLPVGDNCLSLFILADQNKKTMINNVHVRCVLDGM